MIWRSRRKLYNLYGPEYINLRGPIPAHILGGLLYLRIYKNAVFEVREFKKVQYYGISVSLPISPIPGIKSFEN